GGGVDEGSEEAGILEPLGREPCGSPLEHPAKLDRVRDVRARERADDEAPARERLEEPLVGERLERHPEGRPRDAHPLGQLDLRQAVAGRDLAAEHELPQSERRLGRLRTGAIASSHRPPVVARAYKRRRAVRKPPGFEALGLLRGRFCMPGGRCDIQPAVAPRVESELLLVGSLPAESTESALRQGSELFGDLVFALPDGETGPRAAWVGYERERLMKPNPAFELVEATASPTGIPRHAYETPIFKVREGAEVRWDTWPRIDDAIESYGTFRALRDEGVVPAGVRFQVG